ncbi:MAG: type II toxin-antitoxin system RelE/ParE family toxin [Marinobacter sp.]|uniref:type II toxin-antitoxin system RelE/ParE family toxin n=1 Tax=Marinobacter sp. AC-23 TaxID=1879031 RepID=UPI0008DD7636|nr:type II toxin-antitoxin system RelE/ParE family toxin [Marinobacter sp. AC-23]OHY79832.1 plasmid stabilization protein ParE [Marinobacter sp. AC-23]
MLPLWTVEFSQQAANDFDDIIRHTFKNFGQRQAKGYSQLIGHSIQELSESGPSHPLAQDRSELIAGTQSMHIQRQGHRAKHILFFKTVTENQTRKIVILRLLHKSMDFGEHL